MQLTLAQILRQNLVGLRLHKIDDDVSVKGAIEDATVVIGTINGVELTIRQDGKLIKRLLPFDQKNLLHVDAMRVKATR